MLDPLDDRSPDDPSLDATPQPLVARERESCVECDYPLVHLGDAGRCPECGTPFSRDGSFVVSGWNTRRSSVVFRIIFIVCAAVLAGIAFVHTNAWPCVLLPAASGFAVAWQLWRERDDAQTRGGEIEWLVREDGIRSLRRGKEIGFRPWSEIRDIEARRPLFGVGPPWIVLRRRWFVDFLRFEIRRNNRPAELHGRRAVSFDEVKRSAYRLDAMRRGMTRSGSVAEVDS